MWLSVIQLGVRNLLLHKLRSFLTMLGTILGVGSVIAMLAVGEGSKRAAVEQIRQLGASNVIIRSVKPGQNDDGGTDQSASGQNQISYILEYGLLFINDPHDPHTRLRGLAGKAVGQGNELQDGGAFPARI